MYVKQDAHVLKWLTRIVLEPNVCNHSVLFMNVYIIYFPLSYSGRRRYPPTYVMYVLSAFRINLEL